ILSITVKKENKELVEDGTLVTIQTNIGDLDLINTSTSGTQSKLMAATQNGIARVVLTSPNNIIGEAEIIATAGGVSASVKISIVPGPVAYISMKATPENLTADGKSQSNIKALVTDANGNPVVNGETVLFEIIGMGQLSTTGMIGSGTTIDGYASIVYTAPSNPGTVTIAATCGSNDTVKASLFLSLVEASVGSVDVSSDESFLMADGSSFTFVRALVKDEAGNPVANGTAVTFSTNLGDLDKTDNIQSGIQSTVTVDSIDGIAIARLTSPPKVIGTALATVTATVGGVPGTTSINIVVGPVAKIDLNVDDPVLVANGSDTIQIRADVTDINNNAVADGERVNFIITQPSGSSSTQSAFTTSGICSIVYSAGVQTGTVQVQAHAANNASVTDTLTLSLVDRVATIQLVASPLELNADGSSRSEISAYVIDGKGASAANGENIVFAILSGSGSFPFGSTSVTSGGKATVTYMASATPGKITIIAKSDNNITDIIELTLTGDEKISLKTSQPYLIADGSSCQLTASLTDKAGNSVPDGTFITFETTLGDIDDINKILVGVQKEVRVSTINGLAIIKLTSPTNMIGKASITAKSEDISSLIEINIVPGPANWIQLSATPNNLNADGLSTSSIRAVVTDIHGNRIIDGETIHFQLKNNNGRLSATTGSTTNGETAVIYTAGYTEGTATLEAWSDSYSSTRQTVNIALIDSGIKVESVTLTSEKDSIIADGSSCWIIATIRNDSGNIVKDGARVTFTSTMGDLDPYTQTVVGVQRTLIAETQNGQARVRLISPTNTFGKAEIIATIGGVSQILNIQIVPGLPKNLVLTASPNNLFADGMSTSVIKAFVSDAFGNTVVDGETVTFTLTGSGRFAKTGYTQATASTTNGLASVSYIAGSTEGTERIMAVANSSGVTQSIPVTLINGEIEIDSVILYADKTILTAGGYTCLIKATVKDQDENFITDGTMVTFTTTIGDIDHTQKGTQQIISRATSSGQATIVMTTPTNILGKATVTVTVGGKSAEQVITIVPGPVAQINLSVTSNAGEITTAVASETTIKANVMDTNGNKVVDGETIVFSIDVKGGESNRYTTSTIDGVAQMTYYLSSSAETVTITATSVSTQVKASKTINLADPNVVTPHDMSISTDKQTIQSDNTDMATITAIVLDKNFAVLSGVTVNFSANGGLLSRGSAVTNIGGEATVKFSSGDLDKQNRIIMITATVEGIEKSIPIQIIGSSIEVSCDKTSVTDDGTGLATCLGIVKDAGGHTIYNTPVLFSTGTTSANVPSSAILVTFLNENGETPYTFTSGTSGVYSATGGSPGPYSVMTNINGQVNFKVKGIKDKIGAAKLIFKALGDIKQQEFIINEPANAFGIIGTTPSRNDAGSVDLNVGEWMGITVNTGSASADPVTVVFSSTIGQFWNGQSTARMVISQASGKAYTELRSSVAGLASIQVYREDKTSISDSMNVAISHSPNKAGQLILQSEANVIPMSKNGVTHTVELKATVLTATGSGGQVVGNAPVVFSIVNPVGGGEFLSPVVVHTDSSGVARSIFTSGTIGSDSKGITITATLVDKTSISSYVNLVIGGIPGSVSIGIGSLPSSLNDATYSLPISVLVSDANGNNISGTAVSLNIWPEKYSTGYWTTGSGCNVVFTGTFPNEDINQNLILDSGEDFDNNGKLTPSSSSAGNVPSVVYTDRNGVASFDLVYLKSSMWITARLSASTLVQGTEAVSVASFRLPFVGDDSCYLADSPYLASPKDVAAISVLPALPDNPSDPYHQFNAGGISCNNNDISCNGRWTSIIATLQDNSGNIAKDGIPIVVTTTAGSLASADALTSNSTPLKGGVRTYNATSVAGKVTLKLFSSDKLGKAIVTVESDSTRASTIVEFIAGPPGAILINPSPVSLPANGEDQSEILVTVLDATDNPVSDGEKVNISVDYGILDKRVGETKDGFVKFIYTAPTSLPGNEVANIHAVVSNGVERYETINLTGPPIAGIDISIEPDTLPMDGVSKATVFATVSLSGGGNVPDGTTVNFSIVAWTAEKGVIEETGMTAGGIARAVLTAGTTLSPVTIRAEAGGRMAEIVIKYTQGSMNVSIVPNAILGTGVSYASIVAVPRDVTGNVEENAVVIFETDNTIMGGFVEYTSLTNELLSTGGSSRITALVNNGEARAYFIGSSIGGSVKILAGWDQNLDGDVDSNEVAGYDTLDIQPPPSFINIAENSPNPSSINIKGTGGVSTSQITFDVKDSSGQLVADGYKIIFSINSGPDGGEDIQPLFAYTKDGKVTTILRSGFKSGPVSIKAIYYYDTSISTNTSQVAISAGPPVGEEFGLSARFQNISGLSVPFLENQITVNAGDIYGNMIPDNTIVSFKTYNTGGLFQPNVAVTKNGIASNTLITTGTNPEPMQGFVFLTAEANNGGRTTRITCITVTPDNNHILYAGTNGGGVYKSTNYGADWVNVSRSSVYLGQNVIDPFINDIAVDPVDPNTVYVATGYLGRGNIYRSLDGGLNWNSNNTKEWNGLLNDFNSAVLTVLCDDYDGYSRNIWIGTDGQGILYSQDGGNSFMKLGISEPVDDTILLVESESEQYSNPNNRGNGYMRRPDLSCGATGQTWRVRYEVSFQSSDKNTNATFTDISISNGVGSESWMVRKSGTLYWVLTNASSSETYTATLDANREASFDTSTPLSFSVIESQQYTSVHGESFVFYFDGAWKVFASQTGEQGATAETGAYYLSDNEDVEFIIIAGSVPFGHNDTFAFKTDPGGMGCGKTVKDIVKVPGTSSDDATLFAAASSGVYKSINGGKVWSKTTNFVGDNITTLEVIKRGSDIILFAGTQSAGVWYTTDSGTNWVQYNDGLGYGLRATTPKANVNNIGNGSVVVSLTDDDKNTKTETWLLECVKTGKNGGQFSVTGTSSGVRLTATVGSSYEYTEMTLYIIDGDKDFQKGDRFSFRTIRDAGLEIKDLVVYSDPTYTQRRLYAVTYFWGVLEPHAVGSLYSVNLSNAYIPDGEWTRKNEISGLPPYEPPGDQSLFAQHVLVLNTADDYKPLNERKTPGYLYIGGEGINFYTTDVLSNLSTGDLNWQESNIGLSNLIMARRPVLFSGNCTLSAKEKILWGNKDTVAYVLFEIYVQDANGNPPIEKSSLTYKLYTYDEITSVLTGMDPENIWIYPDSIISQGTYMDKSNPLTNNPFKLYLLMGRQANYQAVEFEFKPSTFIGEGDAIIPPGSSGVDQKTQKFEYY
ncbi:MAG: Ig-like domain-containing protein, partial [Candidatus Magnetomorum sp.]|nr:Ig-like domain-containing protein [Candidatus Magnetomorum sp.]